MHLNILVWDSLKRVSVSTNLTDRILNVRPQTFFTPPQNFLYTRMCASDSYRSQSHASAKRECERAHASDAIPTRESKFAALNSRILASTRKRTLEYSQSYSRAIAIELACTRKYMYSRAIAIELACTREYMYSQSNSRVLAIIPVGNNFCGCVTQSY